MSFAFCVAVPEPGGSDSHGTVFLRFLLIRRGFLRLARIFFAGRVTCLDQEGGDWLRQGAFGCHRAVFPIKQNGWGLDDVGVLPQASITGVERKAGSVVGNHAACGYVNRRRRSQQGAVRLLAEIAVRSFDVVFGSGLASGAVDVNHSCRCSCASLDDSWTAGEHSELVSRCVARLVGPSLGPFLGRLTVGVGDVSLLDDGIDAASGNKSCVQGSAGADAVGLIGR